MARKQKHEEHENHERWLVSYADFITLLFAFFVVMYSISSVNEGKYRVLSDAIVAAFRSQEKSIRPIQVGQPTRAPKSTQMEVQKSPGIVKSPNPPIQLLDQVIEQMKTSGKLTKQEREMLELIKKLGGLDALEKLRGLANLEGLDGLLDKAGLGNTKQGKLLSDQEIDSIKDGLQKLADLGGLEGLEKLAELGGLQGLEELAKIGGLEGLEKLISAAGSEGARNMAKIADDIEQAMSALIQKELITVDRSDQWIEVEINTSILYPSGSAHLQPEAVPVLKELARILREFPNPMRIEGFTDNVPINTIVYPSNWELSTARASRVVRLFTAENIAPERMAAIGYGEYRPVATNDTAEGRAKNRRVVLVVLANHDVEDLFNSGALKSGQRTAGFNLPGRQPDKNDVTPEQSSIPDSGNENITITPPQEPPRVIQKPQEAVEINQPELTGTTPLPELPAVTQDTPPEAPVDKPEPTIPVKEVEPVVTHPEISNRQPVIFPSQPGTSNVINGTAPVINQRGVMEPVITVPSPVLLPPIKFIPPISGSVGGNMPGNPVKPGELSGNVDRSPKRASIPDRGRETITITPRETSSVTEKPQNDSEIKQPTLTGTKSLPDQSAITQDGISNTPVNNAEPVVKEPKVSNRQPVVFPSQPGAPNVINGTAPALNQPGVAESMITIPSPVLLPPIKFIPPISRPVGGVSGGNSVRPDN